MGIVFYWFPLAEELVTGSLHSSGQVIDQLKRSTRGQATKIVGTEPTGKARTDLISDTGNYCVKYSRLLLNKKKKNSLAFTRLHTSTYITLPTSHCCAVQLLEDSGTLRGRWDRWHLEPPQGLNHYKHLPTGSVVGSAIFHTDRRTWLQASPHKPIPSSPVIYLCFSAPLSFTPHVFRGCQIGSKEDWIQSYQKLLHMKRYAHKAASMIRYFRLCSFARPSTFFFMFLISSWM